MYILEESIACGLHNSVKVGVCLPE